MNLRKDILTGLLPYFQKLRSNRLLELTVTPYYHPLLPLLADLGQARPEAPDLPSFEHPEDAAWHLDRARVYFRGCLGWRRPASGRPKVPSARWPASLLPEAATNLP